MVAFVDDDIFSGSVLPHSCRPPVRRRDPVDPRWLLQSLRLHYSQLLAHTQHRPKHPTLARRIRGPLRPPLPREDHPGPLRPAPDDSWVRALARPRPAARGRTSRQTTDPVVAAGAPVDTATTEQRDAPAAQEHHEPPPPPPSLPTPPPPSLSPRILALTEDERDFAVTVAGVLRTPPNGQEVHQSLSPATRQA